MSDFKKLHVWQKAHALAVGITDSSKRMRGPAHTSLRSQLVRAAMSIDANIAEGNGQRSDKEFVRFLNIAINSAYETESHLIMANDTAALDRSTCVKHLIQLIEVRRMLFNLQKKIQARVNDSRLPRT